MSEDAAIVDDGRSTELLTRLSEGAEVLPNTSGVGTTMSIIADEL